jgi:hypothetical protein
MKSAIFWGIMRRSVVLFTDVSGKNVSVPSSRVKIPSGKEIL